MAKKYKRVLNTGATVTNPAWQNFRAGGGGGGGQGTVGRIFDVLSRPNYAVANAVKRGTNPTPQGGKLSGSGFVKGFMAGLSGKEKTTFSNVLAAKGVKGPLKGVGGFAMDVLFDPTTYLGVGLARRGVQQGVEAAVGGGARQAAVRGLPDPTAARPLELRLGSRPIAQSQVAGNVLARAGRPVAQSRPAQLLGQTFVPGFGMPAGTHALERQFAGKTRARVDEKASEVREYMRGLTAEQDKLLRRAINENRLDTLDDKLRPVGDYMKAELRSMENVDDKISKLEGRLGIAQGKVERARTPKTRAAHEAKATKIATKIEEAGKFQDYFPYRGADKPFDRASTNLLVQYEDFMRRKSYADFLDEVDKRFGPEVKAELGQHQKRLHEVFGVRGENSAAWQHYFNVAQGHWKRYVTAYRPGFHVRNMLGDGFNNFLVGVDVRRYGDAGRILRSGSRGDVRISVGKKGETYSAAEMDQFYKDAGLETAYLRADEIERPTRGVGAAVTRAGDAREKFMRMANFVDAFDKARRKGLSMDDAISEAGQRVRRYNFDYTDLTPAERKLRMFIPFYTYTRKELPLLLEHTFSSPGKILTVPKGQRAIQELLGVENDPDDPFPGLSEALPDWLREATPPVQLGSDRVLTPGPPTDILQMTNPLNAVRETAGMVSPFLTTPLEVATGRSFPEGYPQNQPLSRYLVSQFAPWGNLAREGPTPIRERVINALTGAGYRDLSRYGR